MNQIFCREYYAKFPKGNGENINDKVETNSKGKTKKISKKKKKNYSYSLLQTLWYISKPTFIPGGFCQLIAVLCQVFMPLLVRQLLRVLEENPRTPVIKEGMPYAIGIFLCLFINAFMNHRHRHLAMKTGIILRSTLVGVIYERILKLNPQGKLHLTSGEVTTLVAIDTQKLFEVTQEIHLIWSMPLSMTLVMICLMLIMGPTTLVGLGVFLLFVPIIERVVSKIQSIRHLRVKVTDRRVEIINSMLQGVSFLLVIVCLGQIDDSRRENEHARSSRRQTIG